MNRPRVGTRGSALALAQASWVAERLGATGGELVVITTAGDRNRAAGDKSRWTGALERALLDGEIDLAVHSAKDVPGELGPGTTLLPSPPRADPRDVLVGADCLAALPDGARVGTSALRRQAQLLATRADLRVVELRGNVDTRLAKLAAGEVDAIVLAQAGLLRLGRAAEGGTLLEDPLFVPAAGQGTLAFQARGGDEAIRAAVAGGRGLADAASWTCLRAERAVVRALDASCHTPVGAHARPRGDGLVLTGFAGLPDGSAWVLDEVAVDGEDPEAAGRVLAERMISAGAGELIAGAERIAA